MSTKKSAHQRAVNKARGKGFNVADLPWSPFIPGILPTISEDHVRAQAESMGKPYEEVLAVHQAIEREETIWLNTRYQVNIRQAGGDIEAGAVKVVHLSIKRRDKKPVHDWRDIQRIKNELVGPECDAVEIYPAESRLVDTANQYHLWVFADPTYRFPLGFNERLVTGESAGGATQRPFEL